MSLTIYVQELNMVNKYGIGQLGETTYFHNSNKRRINENKSNKFQKCSSLTAQ